MFQRMLLDELEEIGHIVFSDWLRSTLRYRLTKTEVQGVCF